jgi:serine/threonine protein kinase
MTTASAARQWPRHVQRGETLRGKYRNERVLAEGGMGVILLATHLRLSQLVAIKMLRPRAMVKDAADTDVAMRRFAREARAASRLRGEHCVRVLDVDDSESGEPFFVMEYLVGRDLHKVLRAEGPLPVSSAVDYLLQACEGLAEAHAAGIVHRDLKPANLFVTTRPDGRPLVKILDFGISKLRDTDGHMEGSVTRPEVTVGSPSYMSPEQIRNASDVDARADVWALGVVLYQLLSDALPFVATNPTALVARIAADPPRQLLDLRPDVPKELAAVVHRCLSKDRSSRIVDVAVLARALAPFGSGRLSSADRVARVIAAPPHLPEVDSTHERSTVREEDSQIVSRTMTLANTPAPRRPWVFIAAGIAERWARRTMQRTSRAR